MCECDIDIVRDAKRVGRAHYVCPKCHSDITLIWFLMMTDGVLHKHDVVDNLEFRKNYAS